MQRVQKAIKMEYQRVDEVKRAEFDGFNLSCRGISTTIDNFDLHAFEC